MTIVAVCVVSAANAPLFLRVYADEDETLRFHTLLHCALDATDERLAAPPRKEAGASDAYLGCLGPADELLVYGYCTATRVKLLLLVDAAEAAREDSLRETFRRLHGAYVEAVSNPWQPHGKPLAGAAFGRAADAAVRASRAAAAAAAAAVQG